MKGVITIKKRVEAIVENKIFFLWGLRTSAGFVFLSVFPILFVLIDVCSGTLNERLSYISQNYILVHIAWSLLFAALVAICYDFTILLFWINRLYRPILQWAWFITVVAVCASIVYLLLEIFFMPLLMQWLMTLPMEISSNTLTTWDQSLFHLSGIFIPISLSISGLIYTAVMFQIKEIPSILSYWSFGIWSIVLMGSCFSSFLGGYVSILLAVAILLYVPWIWQVAKLLKNG